MLKSRSGEKVELRHQEVITPELHHIINSMDLFDLAEILHTFIPDEIETEMINDGYQHKNRILIMYCAGNTFTFRDQDNGWDDTNENSPSTETLTVTVELDVAVALEMVNKFNEDNPFYQFFQSDKHLCIRQIHDFRYGGMRVHHFISNLQSLINITSLLTTKCHDAS